MPSLTKSGKEARFKPKAGEPWYYRSVNDAISLILFVAFVLFYFLVLPRIPGVSRFT